MDEAEEKARALLAAVDAGEVPMSDAADLTKALAQSLMLLAAICDALAAESQRADLARMDAEREALRAEVERLKARGPSATAP